MDQLSQQVSIIVIGCAFFLLVAIGIAILVFVYQKKQNLYLREKAELKAAFEKELLEAQLEMQELTLKSISEEIHDNIGQTLSLAKLNLNRINPEKPTGVFEKINDTKELVGKAITDLRILSKSLHAEAILSLSLPEALEMELKRVQKTEAFETALQIVGTPSVIDPQKELILFRVIQEALNNAIKHSEADQINVQLHYTTAELRATITDNGKGLDEKNFQNAHGSGLRNMRNRAKMIGGALQIAPQQKGTQISLNLPIIVA